MRFLSALPIFAFALLALIAAPQTSDAQSFSFRSSFQLGQQAVVVPQSSFALAAPGCGVQAGLAPSCGVAQAGFALTVPARQNVLIVPQRGIVGQRAAVGVGGAPRAVIINNRGGLFRNRSQVIVR